ncbi:MAG TPA: hypothetical protein VFW04_08855 [Gemmatimonadaceae bacterium]|nr:hypothetical protein [Gemmatimonadaceae bacterium]
MRRLVILGSFFSAALVAGSLTACGSSSVDGKYYSNASGEFAMELSHGKVLSMEGQPASHLTYEVHSDSVILHDPEHGLADHMAFHIEKDGSLSLGILGTLTKKR